MYAPFYSKSKLVVPHIYSGAKGQNSLRYLGSVQWNNLPSEIRNSDSLYLFKIKLKSWKPNHCPCRLCKDYVNVVGFVNFITWCKSLYLLHKSTFGINLNRSDKYCGYFKCYCKLLHVLTFLVFPKVIKVNKSYFEYFVNYV